MQRVKRGPINLNRGSDVNRSLCNRSTSVRYTEAPEEEAMGRACTVCRKPEAGEIARLLEEGRSSRSVALEFGVSPAAMLRHVNGHDRPVCGSGDAVDAVDVYNRRGAGSTDTTPIPSTSWSRRSGRRRWPATRPSSTSTGSRSPPRPMHGTRHRHGGTSPTSPSGSRCVRPFYRRWSHTPRPVSPSPTRWPTR